MLYKTLEVVHGEFSAPLYVYLQSYSREIAIEQRPMVVLLPGGGYMMTSDREAEPVAFKLLAMGISVCVLRYSVRPAHFPTALVQTAKTIAMVRENAGEWHVDTGKVFVMGFSAGGHLAASMGCFWKEDFLGKETGLDAETVKPDGMLLCYPVITSGEKCHADSFVNLLGEDANDPVKRELVSLEKQVSTDTPPAFIWHTYEDGAVPVENSLMMMDALRRSGVPFEAHIYPKGGHGLSLASELTESPRRRGASSAYPEIRGWIDLAGGWIQSL